MKKVLIFLLLAAGLLGAWFFFKSHAAAAEDNPRPAAKVETTTLQEQTIVRTIEVFGVITAAPSGDRVISAPYDSLIRQVHASVGTPVVAGELLLEVDPSPDAKLAADSARNVLALATKALAATQERYDLKLATSQDLLAAQQVAEDARLKADSFSARGLTGDGRIVAPVTGVVSRLDVMAGALAAAGTGLVTVSTGGRLEARLGVEAADVEAVIPGQRVMLESTNRSGVERRETTVRTVGAVIDPATGAAEVRVPVPADAPFLLGEHVRAWVELQKKDHALVVPRSAVLPEGEKQILFTVQADRAVKHEVKVGLATSELLEVSGEGLRAGDVIVTLGNYELEEGMAVQPPAATGKSNAMQQPARPAPENKP